MRREICRLEQQRNFLPFEYRLFVGKPFHRKQKQFKTPKKVYYREKCLKMQHSTMISFNKILHVLFSMLPLSYVIAEQLRYFASRTLTGIYNNNILPKRLWEREEREREREREREICAHLRSFVFYMVILQHFLVWTESSMSLRRLQRYRIAANPSLYFLFITANKMKLMEMLASATDSKVAAKQFKISH